MTQEELKIRYPHIQWVALMGGGWDVLLISLYNFIHASQTQWAKLKDQNKWSPALDRAGGHIPLFNCVIAQVKEKFGQLRIYVDITASELDPINFDQEAYDIEFKRNRNYIFGYIAALETLSGIICENCGERGSRRDCNGWLKTLCEKCYAERMK